MNTSAIVSALLAAADSLDGKPSVKEVLEDLLSRTGKAEELLATLADIYDEKKETEQYKEMGQQMSETSDVLRAAADSIAQVWES